MSTITSTLGPFQFQSRGAILQAFLIDGKNIVLGFKDGEEYGVNPAFLGSTIGRVANRIADGKIDELNGQSYKLARNNGKNNLHGGAIGWNQKYFEGPAEDPSGKKLIYTLASPHLEENFPGTLNIKVTYTDASRTDEDGIHVVSLIMEYEAKLSEDSPVEESVCSMTNHGYFNIGDGPTITGTQVTLPSTTHVAVNEHDIPTGELTPYPGLKPGVTFTLGDTEPDIDHGIVVVDTDPTKVPLDTRGQSDKLCARLYHPDTGITVEILSTEPQFQLYTGKYIKTEARKDGTPAYGKRAGIALEPCRFTNAVNVPEWRDMVLLKKGQTYGARIVYRAWTSSS